jgi:hypothetical protein
LRGIAKGAHHIALQTQSVCAKKKQILSHVVLLQCTCESGLLNDVRW